MTPRTKPTTEESTLRLYRQLSEYTSLLEDIKLPSDKFVCPLADTFENSPIINRLRNSFSAKQAMTLAVSSYGLDIARFRDFLSRECVRCSDSINANLLRSDSNGIVPDSL